MTKIRAILIHQGEPQEFACDAAFLAFARREGTRSCWALASLDGDTGELLQGADLVQVWASLSDTLADDEALPAEIREAARRAFEVCRRLAGLVKVIAVD